MRHVVCQHCPEMLEFIDGAWRTVPTLRTRAGAIRCKGMTTLEHKPMPEIKVNRA